MDGNLTSMGRVWEQHPDNPSLKSPTKKTSKTKTFPKDIDPSEVFGWFAEQLDKSTESHQPEGTDWSGGQPGPIDPIYNMKHKVIVTITSFID